MVLNHRLSAENSRIARERDKLGNGEAAYFNVMAFVMCFALVTGVAIIGTVHYTSKENIKPVGWLGPISCVTVSTSLRDGSHELCPRTYARAKSVVPVDMRSSRRAHKKERCTLCDVAVACGATDEVPNLVDGKMVLVPRQNMAGKANDTQILSREGCMGDGQSFQGYYKYRADGTLRVEPRWRLEGLDGDSSPQAALLTAPFIILASALSLLGVLCYYLLRWFSSWQGATSLMPTECFGEDAWGPDPHWRSEYNVIKGGGKQVEASCQVCLSAPCGDVVFVGCGHAVVCLTCSGLLRYCPVCSEPIEGVRIDESLLL